MSFSQPAARQGIVPARAGRLALRSIQLKMFGVICALMLALVTFLATYFPAQHVAAARLDLEHKADTYARVIAPEVESAIAFDDQQTVREVFEAIATDKDVVAMGLYTAAGRPLHVLGEPTMGAAMKLAPGGAPRIERLETMIRATVAVVSREGPRGTLVLELSTASLDLDRRRVRRAALLAALPALAFGLIAAWLVARSIGGRVRAVARVAAAVAAGDLSQPRLVDASADEVGQLARSFNDMMAEIERLLAQISATAAEEQDRLARLVAARTEELRHRNDDLRGVLDNVGEGFVTIDLQGRMSRERSATLTTWFGPAADETTFWEYLAPIDPQAAMSFEIGFEMIIDGALPLELTIDQMPRELHHGARSYALGYTPILADGALVKVMLVVCDTTSEVERARVEAEARDTLNIFERTRQDGEGLAAFIADTEPLIRQIVAGGVSDDPTLMSRQIHTVKGTSGMFGFPRLTRLCHAMESRLAETGDAPTEAERTRLAALWSWIATTVESMASEAPASTSGLCAADRARLRDLIIAGRPRVELLSLLASLDLEPTDRRLERLGEHARSLAPRLDKPAPTVRVESNGVRFEAARWAPFWSTLVHLVRNAMDHGVEPPAERLRAGKTAAGNLGLRTLREGRTVVVEVSDDGGGIDWDAVAARARRAGLPSDSQAQLEAALFHDGVSTKDGVSEYSGRGVGLGAVRAACVDLGGSVAITSVRGQGTVWRFQIPTPSSSGPIATPTFLSLPPPPRARSASLSMSREAPAR